jgi:hypothetical protein
MAGSFSTPRPQRFPPNIAERSYPTLGASSQLSASASTPRRAAVTHTGAPPFVFPRAANPTTPVHNNLSPFNAQAPASPTPRSVRGTSPELQEVPWLSSTLDDGQDEEDEYNDEPEDGSVVEYDLDAESRLEIDGGEVRSPCLLLVSLADHLFRPQIISRGKRCRKRACESARPSCPLGFKNASR